MNTSDVVDLLKTAFPAYTIYNNFINDKQQCVGVYSRGDTEDIIAIGGRHNSSYYIKPIQVIIHWSEDANESENVANGFWSILSDINTDINGEHVKCFKMLTSSAIELGRDNNNICEFSIRTNLMVHV